MDFCIFAFEKRLRNSFPDLCANMFRSFVAFECALWKVDVYRALSCVGQHKVQFHAHLTSVGCIVQRWKTCDSPRHCASQDWPTSICHISIDSNIVSTPIDADIDLTMKLLVIVRSIDCAIEATRMFIVELNNEYYTANGFMLQHQHTLNIIMSNVPNVNDSSKSSVTRHIDGRFLFDWISWRWSMQGWQKTIPFVAASITNNEQWARARHGRTHCNFGVNWACQLFFCRRSKELSNPRSKLFMIHPFTGFIHSRFNNRAKQNKH